MNNNLNDTGVIPRAAGAAAAVGWNAPDVFVQLPVTEGLAEAVARSGARLQAADAIK